MKRFSQKKVYFYRSTFFFFPPYCNQYTIKSLSKGLRADILGAIHSVRQKKKRNMCLVVVEWWWSVRIKWSRTSPCVAATAPPISMSHVVALLIVRKYYSV